MDATVLACDGEKEERSRIKIIFVSPGGRTIPNTHTHTHTRTASMRARLSFTDVIIYNVHAVLYAAALTWLVDPPRGYVQANFALFAYVLVLYMTLTEACWSPSAFKWGTAYAFLALFWWGEWKGMRFSALDDSGFPLLAYLTWGGAIACVTSRCFLPRARPVVNDAESDD
jgi:hypothetical protein